MRFQIFSLNGGGYLGLSNVSVLAGLEGQIAVPVDKWIAGTSTDSQLRLDRTAK